MQLTPEEVAAVEDDRDKLAETHERTRALPPPRTLHQRGKGMSTRGIPVEVINGKAE